MSNLHTLARSESFHRLPETCPAVYRSAVKLIYAFTKWVDTRFETQLTEAERNDIAGQINARVTDLVERFKYQASMPLRSALIREIEFNLRLSLTQERIDQIEAGVEPEATNASTNANCKPA